MFHSKNQSSNSQVRAQIYDLASAVGRLHICRHNPHQFFEDKDEIAQRLFTIHDQLAGRVST